MEVAGVRETIWQIKDVLNRENPVVQTLLMAKGAEKTCRMARQQVINHERLPYTHRSAECVNLRGEVNCFGRPHNEKAKTSGRLNSSFPNKVQFIWLPSRDTEPGNELNLQRDNPTSVRQIVFFGKKLTRIIRAR